ncbi:hypothetical protein PENTCL1PPCAC_24414, partial [Pristionchus entomophagus]
ALLALLLLLPIRPRLYHGVDAWAQRGVVDHLDEILRSHTRLAGRERDALLLAAIGASGTGQRGGLALLLLFLLTLVIDRINR